MTTSRTFQVIEEFERIHGNGHGGKVTECREKDSLFTVENISEEGSPPVYIDHSAKEKIPFSEAELVLLIQKFFVVERFPKPRGPKT
jgi:hypothetical protein